MKYRLVLLDDRDQVVGSVLTLRVDPHSLVVVMPADEGWTLNAAGIAKITEALAEHDIQSLVLPYRVSFVRLEQVNE